MGYVRSNSGGTALNANVSSFELYWGARIAAGDCVVVKIVWQTAHGSGSLNVTDLALNLYNRVLQVEDGTSGLFIECWVALDVEGGNIGPVVATYTGSDSIHDIAMTIADYSNVLDVAAYDTSSAAWQGLGPLVTSVTKGYAAEILMGIGVSRYNDSALRPGPIGEALALNNVQPPYGTGWQSRESCLVFESIYTWDLQSNDPVGTVVEFSVSPIGTIQSFTSIGCAIIALKVQGQPLAPGNAWLMIDEPGMGLTDRTGYLDFSDTGSGSHSFTNTLNERGTSTIPLRIAGTDPYIPTIGASVYEYDLNLAGSFIVFAGTISQYDVTWEDDAGNRVITITVVSFEQCFDAIRVPPQTLYYDTAANMFAYLYNTYCGGVPVALGITNATFQVYKLDINWDTVGSLFKKLATLASANWGIDLSTLTVYIKPPDTTAAPFAITPSQILFDSIKWNQDRTDFRTRQIVRLSLDAFSDSSELFPVPSSFYSSHIPFYVNLLRPAQTITNAWLTNNVQNSASGTFTGIPAPGDTIIINYPQSGSIYNWVPDAPWQVGQVIIDPAGNVQKCTQGNSNGQTTKLGGTAAALTQIPSGDPGWNDALGGETTDGAIIWTCLGPTGAGGLGGSTYTWVTTLANTVTPPVLPNNAIWGLVKIGNTIGECMQNLVDAINCNNYTRGSTFSWPTWENPLVNASTAGSPADTIMIVNKSAGSGFIASLMSTGTAFSWDTAETSGGTSPFGTIALAVAENGSSNTSNLYYTPGSLIVAVASIPTGVSGTPSRLQIQYQRADGDTIVCEDTALVALRAAVENGTGNYQCLIDDTSNTSNASGLQECQAALSAYSLIPVKFRLTTMVAGLLTGQYLSPTLAIPAALAALIALGGAVYLIQEISGEFVPVRPYADPFVPGAGHFRYTLTLYNVSQIYTYLAFWENMGSGGGGSTSSSSGGLLASQPNNSNAGGISYPS